MNKKQQQDKQLLENIDKAAAGEKLTEESKWIKIRKPRWK